MKYLKEYNTVEEYIEDVSSNPVSYPTLTRIASDSNWGKRMFYRKVMTNDSNPEAMSIARSAGWVGQNDTYMTMEQALAVTDESFNNANVVTEDSSAPNGYATTFANLKHFDEFQYFANVKNLTWTRVSQDPFEIHGGFFNATKLKNVKIPPAMFIMGQNSFAYCASLEAIEIPASVKQLTVQAFMYCNKLKDVKLNEGLNVIQDSVFYHTEIGKEKGVMVLPTTLTYVGDQAFCGGWYNRYADLNLPKLMLWGVENFINQCGPQRFTIGDKLQTIGGGPDYTGNYNDCFWRTLEFITIDENCPNFKTVNNIVYSKDGTICYGGADYGLSKQRVVKIADGCTKIIAGALRDLADRERDPYILEGCPWYDPDDEINEYVVIPASVTYVGNRVMQYTKSNIVFLGSTPPTNAGSLYDAYNIYVPEEAVAAYKAVGGGWASGKIKAITSEVQTVINS